jgi:hypothetical protein
LSKVADGRTTGYADEDFIAEYGNNKEATQKKVKLFASYFRELN